MFLVLVLEADVDVAYLAIDRTQVGAALMHVAPLLVGVLQTLLVEVAADAHIEPAAVLTQLVRAMRHAETFESGFAPVQVGAAIRHDVHLRAGRGVLDEIFLGLSVRAVTNADVFPVGIQTLALGKAGTAAEGSEHGERRENPDERPVVHGPTLSQAI